MSVNTQKPASDPNKQGKPAAQPKGGTPPQEGAGPQKCTVIFKEKGWTMMTYENEDDSSGFILSNGQTAFHFDSNGNMIMASGKPLGGCGGKAIIIAEESQQKYKSFAMEITGNDDDTTEVSNNSGNKETEKTPAYSISVYGDVAIESVGGDIGLKGDNVSINALNTLTLKSEDAIVLDAKGKVELNTGNFNVEALNFNKNISGGDYTKGSGEVKVEQNKQGAVMEVSTPGSVNYVVNGNYTLGVKGDYAINTEGSYALSSKKHYFITALGNADEKIEGKKKLTVVNRSLYRIEQPETYLIETGVSEKDSYKLNANGDIILDTKVGGMNLSSKRDMTIESTGKISVQGLQIFLN
jgi:hypothetical protein